VHDSNRVRGTQGPSGRADDTVIESAAHAVQPIVGRGVNILR
jgi:hypothetical protein